jgi:uncharacterized RDD family membrane protein YckC
MSAILILGVLILLGVSLSIRDGMGFLDALDRSMYVLALVVLGYFLLQTFYFFYLEMRLEGQTYGKRMIGVRTVMATGQGLTFTASLLRNLARVADHVPILLIVPMLDPAHRRIGDLLAGTLVVSAPRKSPPPAWPSRGRADAGRPGKFFFGAAVQDKLFPDDLNLLDHFFERLSTIPGRGEREAFITSLAIRYRTRLGMDTREVRDDPERFLSELHEHLRDRFDHPGV